MTGSSLEVRQPIRRPEQALVGLLEAVLRFDDGHASDLLESAFRRQPAPIKEAIRRHWVTDHLPAYAMVTGISLSDFERDLAERFWGEVRAAEEIHKPRR